MELRGIVEKVYKPRSTSKGDVTDVLLKQLDGSSAKLADWKGNFNADMLGEEVKVPVKETGEYKGTKQYSIIGDFEMLSEPLDAPEEKPSKKTATPSKKRPVAKETTPAPSPSPVEDAPDAVALVRENLTQAKELLGELGFAPEVADVVTVGDMIGRCKVALRIEAGKDRRMKEFNK